MALLLRPASPPSPHLRALLRRLLSTGAGPFPSRMLPSPRSTAAVPRLLFGPRVVAAAAPRRNGVPVRAFMASTTASEAMHEKRVAAEYTAANVQASYMRLTGGPHLSGRPLFRHGKDQDACAVHVPPPPQTQPQQQQQDAAARDKGSGSPPQAATAEEEMARVFRKFDANGDGRISRSELAALFERLGHAASDDEVARMMAEADADGDGFISLDEFAALNATVAGDAAAVEEDLRHAFCVFDADGNISAAELARVLRGLGESASVVQCRACII